MIQYLLNGIHTRLFGDSALQSLVGKQIHYSRGPVTATWPQLVYFDVSATPGYEIDYHRATVQFSMWSQDKYNTLYIRDAIYRLFHGFSGIVVIQGGTVDINYSAVIDSGVLQEADPYLFGQQLRVQFSYRGENLGGM